MATLPLRRAITIGSSEAGQETDRPFGFKDFSGNNAAGDIYQQLYSAAKFGAKRVAIKKLTFFIALTTSHKGKMFYTNQRVSLSTSARTAARPGRSFAANRGADFRTVFEGTYEVGFDGFPIDPCATCTHKTLVITIHPFTYDPRQGDLLLEVTQDSASSDQDHIEFQAGHSDDVSRLYIGGLLGNSVVVEKGLGLKTRFNLAPPPPVHPFGKAKKR